MVLLAAPTLSAQQWADVLRPGQRVRVEATTARQPVQGAYDGLLADSLHLSPERRFYQRDAKLNIATLNLRSVDVSDGRARLKWGVGGIFAGAVVGAVIGAAIGHQLDAQCGTYAESLVTGGCYYLTSEKNMAAGIIGTFGAAAGGLLGGIVGVLGAPEKWRRIYSADHSP